ncbi:thioredoxin, mitochondrial-like [Planococcus citri]|uniref:thioredoxin, mitochondrial-like n=1 Tax=Planococcus citri TaxID=170843 RepID=UPI0031F85AA5
MYHKKFNQGVCILVIMALAIVRNLVRTNPLQSNLAQAIAKPAVRSLVSNSFEVQDPEDFQERVLKSKSAIIVQFHAPWCKPCKILAPRLEKAVDSLNGKIKIARVNVDHCTDVAFDYEVEAIPVVAAFKDGKLKEKMVGQQDEDKLLAFVKKHTDD